jgi:hypothetical protein
MSEPLVIIFPDASLAEGNRLASSLADAVRDLDPNIVTERRRDRPDTQDFGAGLAIILGTAAAREVAKGIAAWLKRNSGAVIEIRLRGEVVFSGSHLEKGEAARIAEAFAKRE